MASSSKKWFIGCGIGCGLFILIAAGVGTVGYLGIRKAMDRGESIEAGFEELRGNYGAVVDYVPAPDGAVPEDRMRVFLAARDAMAADRKEAGDILRTLDGLEVDGQSPNFIDKAKAGINLIPSMMGFIEKRNQALMEQGIGLGEYLYIYTLSYYNLLGKDLADSGPSFRITGNDEEDDSGGIKWKTTSGNEEGARRDRAVTIRTYLHRIHLEMARNQLDALEGQGDREGFRPRLEAEIAALEDEPLRLLWETGLPSALRISLEPFAAELDASYDSMVNVLESGLVESE